jgi:hypothetical protein
MRAVPYAMTTSSAHSKNAGGSADDRLRRRQRRRGDGRHVVASEHGERRRHGERLVDERGERDEHQLERFATQRRVGAVGLRLERGDDGGGQLRRKGAERVAVRRRRRSSERHRRAADKRLLLPVIWLVAKRQQARTADSEREWHTQ